MFIRKRSSNFIENNSHLNSILKKVKHRGRFLKPGGEKYAQHGSAKNAQD